MVSRAEIISYRPKNAETSQFLDVDDFLKSDDYEEVVKVYLDIFHSVTAYDPKCSAHLSQVQEKFHHRIQQLESTKYDKAITSTFTPKKTVFAALSPIIFIICFFLFLKKIRTLACQTEELETIRAQFDRSIGQMDQRSQTKVAHSKPQVIQELESNRSDNPDTELRRLKRNPRIKRSIEDVTEKLLHSGRPFPTHYQVAYGRSLELQEKVKDTHYVINHGQSLALMLANTVARKLKQEFEAEQYESFEPLRHDTALRHIDPDSHTVDWYKEQLRDQEIGNDLCDHDFRRELISGDCVLESTDPAESALHFFACGYNIADSRSFFYDLLLTTIQDYITDREVAEILCEDLLRISGEMSGQGNLYSICIPKDKFLESCYFSKAFGEPCRNQEDFIDHLEIMQSGQGRLRNLQVRILTHKIRPEDGFHVVLNSTLPKDELEALEKSVELSIQSALTGYRVRYTHSDSRS